MKRVLILLFLVLSTISLFGQVSPYVLGGLNFSNSGFQTVSGNAGGGIQLSTKHLFSDSSAVYILTRKSNDNTVDNFHAHVWQTEGTGFLRTGKYFFGGGVQYHKLNTTNYMKQSYNPEFGGGREWDKVRLTALYYLPGNDWQNDEQGVKVSLWANPKGHLFAKVTIGVNFFHDTVTDPLDLSTTAMEKSVRHVTESVVMQAGWRF